MTDSEKTELYEKFAPKVQAYIYGKLNNNADVEDLTSDVFVKVFSKLDSFDSTKSSLSTWIYTITRNTVYDFLRTRRVNEELYENLADGNATPEDEVINEEMLGTLADALESLTPDERKIVILKYYYGEKLTVISQKLDRPYSYVKLAMNRALKKIKKIFEFE